MKVVLCIDLDKFFAAVEEARQPSLKGKAVVICVYSGRSKDSGAVSTANYEARKLGIRSGMPIRQAKQLGKDAVFLPVDKPYYKEVSERIMEYIHLLGNCQQTSIDECYLEVEASEAKHVAEGIRNWVQQNEKITCTVGIGSNKLIAKMACEEAKPNGLRVVPEGGEKTFLRPMEIRKLFGVGKKTEETLLAEGIHTVGELSELPLVRLQELFGQKKGRQLYDFSRGIDTRPVKEEATKQFSRIITLKNDTQELTTLLPAIQQIVGDLSKRIQHEHVLFKHVSLIAITSTLATQTHGKTFHDFVSVHELEEKARELLKEYIENNPTVKLRRLGIKVAELEHQKTGLKTFFTG